MLALVRFVWIAGFALVGGCAYLQEETGGEVSVSRPQVFTRERLLNERLGEVNWLREQLDRPFEQGFQGFRDVREAAVYVMNLQLQYNAADRRLKALNNATADAQGARDARIADLRHQIEATQLEQQLDVLKKSTEAKPPESAVPDSLKTDLAKLSEQINALTVKLDDLEKKVLPQSAVKGTAAGLLDSAQGRLVNPNLAEPTRASLSSRDRLEDEAAFRDHVNSRIREAILDDTHDLGGFALYELKFDATIVPGSNTRRIAIAELEIAPDTFEWVPDYVPAVHMRLRQRTEEDANALIQRQQERLAEKRLDRAWVHRIVTHFNSSAARRTTCADQAAAKKIGQPATSDFRRFLEAAGPRSRQLQIQPQLDSERIAGLAAWGECLIADYVRYRLELELGSSFEFIVRFAEGTDRPLLSVGLGNATTFAQKLDDLRPTAAPWVATVSPKEYAQNISDVASSQQIRQITLGLGLSDTLGSGGRFDAEKYKQEQELAHAIKRQPLAASFVRGRERFGWVLGPKYELKGSRASFVHTTSRYTFTASVAVPGWFSSICLRGRGYWIESDGRRSPSFPLFSESPDSAGADKSDRRRCKNGEALVSLPNTYRALFNALLPANFDLLTDPEIFLPRDADERTGMTTLRAAPESCALAERGDKSCEQSIVVEGRDLWRNPVVFVGEQRADRVDVLPSMRGIVATWKSLRMPAIGPGGRNTPQDLFVSTSAGQDRIESAVYIVPATGASPKPFARLANRVLEKTGTSGAIVLEVGFNYSAAAFPRGYAAMALKVRRLGSKESRLFEGDAERSVGRLTYKLANPESLGFGDRSGDFEIDLMFKLMPGDEWESLSDPSARRAPYFANASEHEVTYAGSSQANFSGGRTFGSKELLKLQQNLRFMLPADEELFFKAYPGLSEALSMRGGEARIALQLADSDGPVEVVAEQTRGKDGRTVVLPRIASLTARQSQILPSDESAATYSLEVTYRQGGVDWTRVNMKGAAQLTVTGLKKPQQPTAAKAAPAASNP